MKLIITLALMLTVVLVKAQNILKVSGGTTIKTSGGVTIVLQDINLDNDGIINQAAGEGGFRLTGTQTATISGTSLPVIGILEVNKTNGGKVLLNRNISINSSLNFITGQLDLNANNILLSSSAMIAGESESSKIIGSNGGFVEITQDMNAPVSVNAGNLGATITSAANLGSVTIRRGHLPQSGSGLANSINCYYQITPANNSSLNATLRLKYFDAELNGQNENSLVIYKSNDNGSNWNNISQTSRNTTSNYVEKAGNENLTFQTLSNDNVIANNGVTGLVFTGSRKKATEVQLKWTSQTETNMTGYQIQRRLKNEADFSDGALVNTLAPGGNSVSQLSYQSIDANSYTDTSYYRLKIVAISGEFSYSNIIAVAVKTSGGGGNGGGGNGGGNPNNAKAPANSLTTDLHKKMTIGPNPNNGNFWFSVNGIEKETTATLYTIDGKQVQQFRVVNLQQQRVNNIKTGIYILKVPGFEIQKVIVNSSGNAGYQSTQVSNDVKN